MSSTPAAAQAEVQEPAPAATEPAEVVAAPPPAALPTRIALGQAAEGWLTPEQAIKLPITLERGAYRIEMFVRAPQHKCNLAPNLALRVVDRDGALIDDGLDTSTWDTINWQKAARTYRLTAGQYAIALKANKWCDVHFRVRISPTLGD